LIEYVLAKSRNADAPPNNSLNRSGMSIHFIVNSDAVRGYFPPGQFERWASTLNLMAKRGIISEHEIEKKKRGKPMTITLTDELEELINAKVRSGAYKSAEEVVIESLRLLKAKEEGMDALRQEIMRGVADITQERFTTYTTDTELEALSDEIIRQGQERRNASGEQ
jgi:putative addiction module CopG family antidote